MGTWDHPSQRGKGYLLIPVGFSKSTEVGWVIMWAYKIVMDFLQWYGKFLFLRRSWLISG